MELNLRFPDADHVIVRLGADDDGSGDLPFVNPITDKNLHDLQWYVETYGAHSLGDPDDSEAARIKKQLPAWGKALFSAVFTEREAQRRFNEFQEAEEENRLLTISAEHPSILALPWELLHDSAAQDDTYLFHEQPSISIRRRVAGVGKGRKVYRPAPKDALHLLFAVSRPDDVGFLDPRADSLPVLDAIDKEAPGRITWEFLRPATLDALLERLGDSEKTPVDILHFDGHGVFDRHGGLPELVADQKTILLQLLAGAIVKDTQPKSGPQSPPNTGYLLFEKPDGKPDFVSADKLGANLHRHKVALVILSACQSAAVEQEGKEAADSAEGDAQAADKRPMGSVAARLTATGIPSVLAMTHSVLVHTTRDLFGEFYKQLARQKGIGEALDDARRYLANHPEKYEVQRGPKRVPLELYDWFVPALYQPGADGPLLTEQAGETQETKPGPTLTNLPKAPEAGFFGRPRELWEIERWFADQTRRITITGFGGQGKTALALEAGRWLTRTGLFGAAVFVDYSRVQARDAVAVAVSNIGSVLGESLPNADAATKALEKTPTLVILDNLEALAAEPLQALLDAAVAWSTAGGSRVLCTTRRPDFKHEDYKVEGTNIHRRIVLDGLGSKKAPDDALQWCATLMNLGDAPTVPAPAREALIELFDRVKFHPLSIRVLAQQLKSRRPANLGERLEQLLSAGGGAAGNEDTPAGLLASLQLSLDKLDAAARQVLPRLGIFHGGAIQSELLSVTEIPESEWSPLRRQLEAAALIKPENVPGVGVPFLRFHPTLAPMLWAQLDEAERPRLTTAHRRRYYALSTYLYNEDQRNPHQARAIAWRELPNLLYAVHAALDAGDPDAGTFATNVNRFLGTIFGLKQEAEALLAQAQTAAGAVGSEAWYLAQSNRGEQLLAEGQVAQATEVFQVILEQLGETSSYERAVTLSRLGRCFRAGGRPDLAAQSATDAIAVCGELEQTDTVKRHRGAMLTDKADTLRDQGKYAEARQAYEDSLAVKQGIGGDKRGDGVVLGQLGTLAMLEGDLQEAADRYRAALALFQQLGEPESEGKLWHLIGSTYYRAGQWDEAERHYREAARIYQQCGDRVNLAMTWNQLALVSEMAGKPEAAERWYRKEIEVDRRNPNELAPDLNNLASLLRTQPGRLAEARQLAEKALDIKKTLDPAAAEIWMTYGLLGEIAEKEAEDATEAARRAQLQAEAREHRRLAREAKRNFAGTRHELKQHLPLILGAIMGVQEPERREELEKALPGLEKGGWTSLVAAIRRILAGDRDADALCTDLDLEDSMIVETILRGLADPSTLADLLPEEGAGA